MFLYIIARGASQPHALPNIYIYIYNLWPHTYYRSLGLQKLTICLVSRETEEVCTLNSHEPTAVRWHTLVWIQQRLQVCTWRQRKKLAMRGTVCVCMCVVVPKCNVKIPPGWEGWLVAEGGTQPTSNSWCQCGWSSLITAQDGERMWALLKVFARRKTVVMVLMGPNYGGLFGLIQFPFDHLRPVRHLLKRIPHVINFLPEELSTWLASWAGPRHSQT